MTLIAEVFVSGCLRRWRRCHRMVQI